MVPFEADNDADVLKNYQDFGKLGHWSQISKQIKVKQSNNSISKSMLCIQKVN